MQIYADWFQADVGQVYSVKILNDSGRVLAVARVEVPLRVGHMLDERIGTAAVREIEQNVRSAAEAVARAMESRP